MSKRLFFASLLVIAVLLLAAWAAYTFLFSDQAQPEQIALAPPAQVSALPSVVTDATGRFRFSSVARATHQVYLIESTLPDPWRKDLPETPTRLLLNPGMAASGRVSPWVVLQAHYQDDVITGLVFADLDQDGQMGDGDVGLAGVTVVDPGLHQFFVPFNDRHLWQLFSEVNRCQRPDYLDVSDTLESYISLTASTDNTQWFYDHWEDGYDLDPLVPGPTTETGVLNMGQTRIFPDSVDTTDLGNAANLQYDGRDRITLSGHPGPMARIVYPTTVEGEAGVVLATAWEVLDVLEWDKEYIAIVGEDLDFNGAFVDDFDYAGIEVMAAFTETQLYRNGLFVGTLQPGDVYFINGANDGVNGGGIDSDDVISATQPIQVQSFVGGCNMAASGWSSQGYNLEPVADWDTSYWAPVPDFTDGVGGCNIDLDGDPTDDRDVDIYIHNPHDAAIVVTLEMPGSAYNGTTVDVPAHSTQSVLGATTWADLPPAPDANNTRSVHLFSTQTFWAMAMVNTSTAGTPATATDHEPRVNDWGYSLVPQRELSSQAVIGWAPGTNPVPAPINNGNLAFVTAITNTVIYVDLEQDGTPDDFDMNGDGDALDLAVYGLADEPGSNGGIPLLVGQVLRVGDPNDLDLDGAIIYTQDLTHKIAVAWGQDACAAGRADPYLDLGYTPMAVSIPIVEKLDALAIDADNSGDVSPGDTLTYSITIENNGYGLMSNAVLTDYLPYDYVDFVLGSIESSLPFQTPPGAEYDDGSNTFLYTPTGLPGQRDPAITAFRLNWAVIDARSVVTITFRVVIQDGIDVTQICNVSEAGSDNTDPVQADTCEIVVQQETPTPTPTATGTPPTPTPTVTGTPPTATPTVTGTPQMATPTVTGTPPTATPTVTGTPPTVTPTPPTSTPQEVPEPLSLVLLGGGLAALAAYSRLRRR